MQSPCIRVCQIDRQTRTCLGCGRTIDEITLWTRYTEEERKKIMENVKLTVYKVPKL
jgi:predicted Fe-S protein YdhL (DUF1289 family)